MVTTGKISYIQYKLVLVAITVFLIIQSPASAFQPQVVAGKDYTIGVKSDGTVVTVGSNIFGLDLKNITNIKQMSPGYGVAFGLKSDGTVMKVAGGEYVRLDAGIWTDIVQIDSYTYNSYPIGLKSDGTVVGEGNNCSFMERYRADSHQL